MALACHTPRSTLRITAMTRARWTTNQRTAALELYREHGPSEAARQTGIPKQTIASWARRSGTHTNAVANTTEAAAAAKAKRDLKREEIRTRLLEKASDMLGRMDEPHIDFRGKDADQVTFPKATSGDCKNYATAAAILIDKFRLEMGEATDRGEQHHRFERDEQTDHRLAKLIDLAAHRKAS